MEKERKGLGGFFKGFGFPSIFGERSPVSDDPFVSAQSNRKEKGIVIQELDSDHEEDNGNENSNPNNEPSIEHPDDDHIELDDRDSNSFIYNEKKPQSRSFSYHSCKITYGGVDGAYYTSATTRKTGSDGVVIEEAKEADKTTGRAEHRISRGIQDKGHSVTRKLNADGKVDTLQTLHNLDEGDLAGFEEAWKNNKVDFPGWDFGFDFRGPWLSNQRRDTYSGGLFLPSSDRGLWTGSESEAVNRSQGAKKVVRINID